MIILPTTSIDSALFSAERVRDALCSYDWKSIDGITTDVTISVGVSEFCEGDDMSSVVRRADQALYRSKAGGAE